MAYALARTVKPCLARDPARDTLMHAIEQVAMPDLRAHWTPNGGVFTRLKKAQLWRVLSVE